MTKNVLSIDGGGIRGLIPAVWIKFISNALNEDIFGTCFDLLVGTSTGGILSLLLSDKSNADDIISLYENEGRHIFPNFSYQTLSSLGGTTDQKYPSDGIESVLKNKFGNKSLKYCTVKTMVTTYDISNATPCFIKSWKDNMLMWEAARATSAAPTYFEPYHVHESLDMIDGGVFVNNPAMCAYAEARKLWPEDKINLVSLGTGILRRNLYYSEAKDFGLLEWARPLINIMMNGQSQAADYQLKQLDGKQLNYHRLQVALNVGNDDMDDTSYTNLLALKTLANDYISSHKEKFDTVIQSLMDIT